MRRVLVALVLGSCAAPLRAAPIEIVVAQDGSGKFKTIQEAVMSVPAGTRETPVIIRIMKGTYKELVYVQREKRFFTLVGESAATTVITQELHANMVGLDGKPIGTFRTPTVTIDAEDFTAENLTFENAAGPVGQALALRVDGDRAIFRRCRFLGWQDTIFLNRGRQYFEDCFITGHVDFIFGGATSYFERCEIKVRRDGYITASSAPDTQPYGFVFAHSKIAAESPEVRTYLGRPWRAYSSVAFVSTEMSEAVRPVGWHNWDFPDREKTARYSEFASLGPGAAAGKRVPWSRQLTEAEANALTPERVLAGADGWNPKAAR